MTFVDNRLPAISLDHCRQYGDWITDWIAAWMDCGWSRGHIEDYSVGSIYGIQTLGPLIWTQRQGGEMIWNFISFSFNWYFLVQDEEDNLAQETDLASIGSRRSKSRLLEDSLGIYVLLAFSRMLWTALSWGGMWCSICVTMPKAHGRGIVNR